jgi:hypothetical protein
MTYGAGAPKLFLEEGGKQPVDEAPTDALPAFEPLKPIERNLSIFLTPVPANAQRCSGRISWPGGIGLRTRFSKFPSAGWLPQCQLIRKG